MTVQFLRGSAVIAAATALVCTSARAIEVGIDRPTVTRAIDIGKRTQGERERFHTRYEVRTGPQGTLDVVTEFRRVVKATEDQVVAGNSRFSAREAEQAIEAWRGRVSIVARVRFNPQTALVAVPAYEISLAGDRNEQEIQPLDIRRTPFYEITTLAGAEIEAVFDAAQVGQRRRTIVLRLPPGQVTAASFDFSAVE